jgi:hypothetical protein
MNIFTIEKLSKCELDAQRQGPLQRGEECSDVTPPPPGGDKETRTCPQGWKAPPGDRVRNWASIPPAENAYSAGIGGRERKTRGSTRNRGTEEKEENKERREK